jgi:hypothetical protein
VSEAPGDGLASPRSRRCLRSGCSNSGDADEAGTESPTGYGSIVQHLRPRTRQDYPAGSSTGRELVRAVGVPGVGEARGMPRRQRSRHSRAQGRPSAIYVPMHVGEFAATALRVTLLRDLGGSYVSTAISWATGNPWVAQQRLEECSSPRTRSGQTNRLSPALILCILVLHASQSPLLQPRVTNVVEVGSQGCVVVYRTGRDAFLAKLRQKSVCRSNRKKGGEQIKMVLLYVRLN